MVCLSARTPLFLIPLLFALDSAASSDEAPAPAAAAQRWDQRYDRETYVYGEQPVVFLTEQIGRLRKGKALVLAAGEGRNAVYLAQQEFQVVAVDISAKGLEKCQALARSRGVEVETVVGDLNDYDMGEDEYDLVTNFYYHDASIFPKVLKALKPGGFFILQNFSVDQPATNRFGPRNPDYLVSPNQLLAAFAGFRIRHYEDVVVELDEGMHRGPGAVVRLLVQKEEAELTPSTSLSPPPPH